MHTGSFRLVSQTPLDEHTATLLAEFAPAEVMTVDGRTPRETLLELSRLAEHSSEPLVVADSELRAESNALANLLDVPTPRSAALLAHNGDDDANPVVLVSEEGYLRAEHDSESAHEHTAAGILVVAPEDLPEFASQLSAAVEELSSADQPGEIDVFAIALTALARSGEVVAVPADPFCASRRSMDMPKLSEHDRRLRAAGQRPEEPITRAVLRPLSSRVTRWAVKTGRRPATMTAIGIIAGIIAALVAGYGGLAALIAGAVLLQASSLALMSAGEVARYWRRPTASGVRWHRLGSRVVELSFLLALGFAAARAGTPAWLLAITAIGMVAVLGDVVAGRRFLHDTGVSDDRALRWLAISLATALAGAAWGLVVAGVAALVVVLVEVGRSYRDRREPPATTQAQRFLTPPGSLADVGVVARILSNTAASGFPLGRGLSFAIGVGVLALGAFLSWGRSPWPVLLGAVVMVFALSVAMSAPLRGTFAWGLPAVLRAVEFVVVAAVASALAISGRAAAAVLIAAVALVTLEAADRWHLRRQALPPWASVLDLGVDGRILVLTLFAAFGAGIGAAWSLAGLLLAVWIGLLVVYSRQRARS